MLVKPVEGRLLIDPRTNRQIPAAGLKVSDTDVFWIRRIAQGDAEKVEETTARPGAPK